MKEKPDIKIKNDEEKVEKPKTLEDLLESTGDLGRFQILALILILWFEIPGGLVSFMPVFTGMMPKIWQCTSDGEVTEMSVDDICTCNGTRSSSLNTIVTEWDLTCEKEWVSDTISSIQMIVMIIGNTVPGQISDWYGRKKAMVGTIVTMIVGQVGSALATDPYVFTFFRCIVGIGVSGFMTIDGLYAMEFLTPRWRQLSACLSLLGESVVILAILGYFIQPWRPLTWATTVPLLAVVFVPFLPESPRWLLRNGKVDEAERVIRYIAKINGKEVKNPEILQEIANQEMSTSNVHLSYLDLLTRKEFRFKTIMFMSIWFCWATQYFGSIFNIANFGMDPYLVLALLGLVDCIGFRLAILVNNRLGRRKALVLFETFAGVFFLALAFMEMFLGLEGYKTTAFAVILVGKFGVAGARTAISCLTAESYPVSIRAMGTGFAKIALVIGATLSPQLGYIGTRWPEIPLFTFAILGILGSFLSLFLDETAGKPLQDAMNAFEDNRETVTKQIINIQSNAVLENQTNRKRIPEPIKLTRSKSYLNEVL